MTNSLPADLAQFVQSELSAGHYHSVEEMVCDSLRLLRTQSEKLDELRRELQPALERLDRGEGIDVNLSDLRQFLDQIMEEVKANMDTAERSSG
jgi:putative addiction module CopG family antidote